MGEKATQTAMFEDDGVTLGARLITCPVCGKKFESDTNHKKYCSTKCSRKAQAKKNIEHITKRTNDIGKIRDILQEVYDGRCAVCGWGIPGRNFKRATGCDVHHIVEACNGGDESETNVILLCPNCHRLAHRGELEAEELRKHLLPWDETLRERRAKLRGQTSDLWCKLLDRGECKEPVTRDVTLCLQCKYGRKLTEEEVNLYSLKDPDLYRVCENMLMFNGHGVVWVGDYCSGAKYDLVRKAQLENGQILLTYSEEVKPC